MSVKLEHHFVTEANASKVFEGVSSFPELFKSIISCADRLHPDNIDARNNFEGMTFEVWGEYFLKALQHHEAVGISDYSPSRDSKSGPDGLGIGRDTNPAVVQFKFRRNVKEPLYFKDLATFGNDVLANYNIITAGEARRKNKFAEELILEGLLDKETAVRKGYPYKDSMHNILIVTSTYGTYYTWDEVNRGSQGSRCLGWKELESLTRQQPAFWKGLVESVQESALVPRNRIPRKLMDFQEDAVRAIVGDLLESSRERAQVIIPSGGGKTTVAHEAIELAILKQGNQGGIYIFVCPRIALTMQSLHRLWDLKRGDWKPVVICSGPDERLEYWENGQPVLVQPTLDKPDIEHWVQRARNGEHVVFFVTNHSVLKIGEVLKEAGLDAQLVVGDEAHNLTAENFAEALNFLNLPAAKWLFLTATRRTSPSKNGKGMNNPERFGEIIYRISPSEVIKRGMIVPPRLHLLRLTTQDMVGVEEGKELSIRDQLGLVVAGVQRHVEEVAKYGSAARVIVFCEGADDAHDFAESETIRKHLPDFYVEAITSKSERMQGKKREDIFRRFSDERHAVLFHYDIVSEGVDLPGVTGILPLRGLSPIKATQGIGRALRVTVEDREALREGRIVVGNPKGWIKPYGWVILPWVPGKNNDDLDQATNIVYALKAADYDVDVEELLHVDRGTSQRPGVEEYDPSVIEEYAQNTVFDVKDIVRRIEHHIEVIEESQWKNFLEAREFARGFAQAHGIKHMPDWRKHADKLPYGIPPNPEEVYDGMGWRGPSDWFGY